LSHFSGFSGRAQTTGADPHFDGLTILKNRGLLDVNFPLSPGVTHGMAYIIPGGGSFMTNITLRHTIIFLSLEFSRTEATRLRSVMHKCAKYDSIPAVN
jgi:hypothetical protein